MSAVHRYHPMPSGSVSRPDGARPAGHDGPAAVPRLAILVIAVLVPVATAAMTVFALLSGERNLLAWTALGWFVTAVWVAQAVSGVLDITVAMILTSAGIAVVAPFAPPTSTPGIVASAAFFFVVLLNVGEGGRRRAVAAAVSFVLLGWAFLAGSSDVASVAALGVMVISAAGAWLVLGRLVARLRYEHGSYRELFDRVPVGLYRTGLGGELLDVNPALAELLGVSRDQLLGRHAQEFFEDERDFHLLREAIGDRPDPLTSDLRFRRADGTFIWVRDQTRPVTDDQGRIVCFEGELQDVTEERRHLEELESLVRSKSELIGAVSHELRTPLTAVVGFLEVLQEGGDDDHPELLRLAADQARDIAGIVEDLLTAARLDNRELTVLAEPVDLAGAVEGAMTSVLGGRPRQVDIKVEPETFAVADAARVRQILRNLVGNALRYGRPPVSVRVAREDGAIGLVVADRGDEIAPEVVARMFDAFFSGGEGPAHQPGSIGLGLAVSRRLARLMGGDLTYTRVDGETCFTLDLPAGPAELGLTA